MLRKRLAFGEKKNDGICFWKAVFLKHMNFNCAEVKRIIVSKALYFD